MYVQLQYMLGAIMEIIKIGMPNFPYKGMDQKSLPDGIIL